MYVTTSLRVICFHDEFYCIGTDAAKVAAGIEDLTEMRTIEPEKMWNPGVCKSTKIFYSSVNSTKEDMILHNTNVMCYPVIEPADAKENYTFERYGTHQQRIDFINSEGPILTFKKKIPQYSHPHNQIFVTRIENRPDGEVKLIGPFEIETGWFKNMDELVELLNWEWMDRAHS